MNRERFRQVIEFMKKIPSNHFDLHTWVRCKKEKPLGTIISDLNRIGTEFIGGHCGTAGCVIGYMPVAFPQYFEYLANQFGLYVVLKGSNVSGFEAMSKFLEIDQGDSYRLFSEDYYDPLDDNTYITKGQVIEKMEEFLKGIQNE